MRTVTYEAFNTDEIEKMIKRQESFELIGLGGKMGNAVTRLERMIEINNMRCRIYTRGRIVAAGATLFGGITGLAGIASAIGIAAHNLATFDPDYEIAKNLVDNKILVKYCK